MRYESESGPPLDDPSEAQIDQVLGELDGAGNSYASLATSDGSYIQVGGGPKEFTVEVREVESDNTFRHLKATLPGRPADERRLTIGGASVSVRSDQVLDLQTIRQLFRSFARGQRVDPSVSWQDITSMFQDGN